LCEWLVDRGAVVAVHDPAVRALPADLAARISLQPDALSAIRGADALVVATPWPDYRLVDPESVVSELGRPIVIDPGRFLAATLGADSRVKYSSVGLAQA
jgi:UDPglucose 6-dehydrogenase